MKVMTDKEDKVRIPPGVSLARAARAYSNVSADFTGSREALCYMGINNRTGAIIRNNISVGILVVVASSRSLSAQRS